jgi:hypothetical protein
MAATDGGAAVHPALVYSVQPGHAALGPEVLAVVRANATRTGTTNPHPASRRPRRPGRRPTPGRAAGLPGNQRGVRGGQDLGPHVVLEQPHPRLRAELPDRRLGQSGHSRNTPEPWSRGPLDCAGMGDLRAHADPETSHGYGWCSRLPAWWRRAKIAAWTRSCRPSLVRMLRTWVLTVCSPIARSRAICRLL